MDIDNRNYIFIRSAFYLVIFIILHYLFDWFPNIFVSLFSGIDESVYQHMKIAFYSYAILTLIEFVVFRKKIANKKNFVYSHLLSIILIPLITLILFLIGAMFYGERPFVVEILYAIIITYASGLSISVFEQEMQVLQFSKRFKLFILIIIVILIMEFTIFTFRLPWHDIFADPYGP
ncbi:MAG: DUF6512 family protein [Candidatus Thorarchaeota archaeon]